MDEFGGGGLNRILCQLVDWMFCIESRLVTHDNQWLEILYTILSQLDSYIPVTQCPITFNTPSQGMHDPSNLSDEFLQWVHHRKDKGNVLSP